MTSPTPSPTSSPSQPDSSAPAPDFAASAEKEAALQPRKRGGFMRKFFLFLLLVAAGAAAYIYYNPALLIAVAPNFLPPALFTPSPPPASSTPAPSASPASPAPSAAESQTAPDSGGNAEKTGGAGVPTIALLSAELAALRGQFTQMESRLNQMDAVVRTARAADSANIRLLLVGLILESNGNTHAAAAALRRIADSASANAESISPELAKLVRSEALRLEQAPDRSRILHQIAELRRLLQKRPDPEGVGAPKDDSVVDKVGGFLRGAFNVSRRDSGGGTGDARENILNHLARMEFYLAANNRGQYRNSLAAAERLWDGGNGWDGWVGGADPNIALKFGLLREFGAPDYRLNLPLDKP